MYFKFQECENLNICVVTTWPPHRDGISIYSTYLYKHIGKKAYVKILANNISSSSFFALEKQGVLDRCRVVRCWNRGSILYPFRIFGRVIEGKPDIIHLQHGWLLYGDKLSPLLFPLLLFILHLTRKPIIVTMHTIVGRNPRLYTNRVVNFIAKVIIIFLTKSTVKLSSKIIVHNNLMEKTLMELYSVREDYWKIFVIPHGVREMPKRHREIQENGDFKKILAFGFIRETKGIEFLIEAFKIFSADFPNSIFIIAGGRHAHDSKEYVNLIKGTLLKDASRNIVFTDFVDENTLDRLILESEIIILPSLDSHYVEASGSLARVAMFGKPVICSKIPKFEAEIEDGKDCIMVEINNPKKLADTLSMLMNNAGLRGEIGRNLKRKFKDRVWSKVAEQHISLFEASLKTR
jgi:glycosyltransferase involved in cell wall biosynthesis